jgi:crotonobetainyl-CoA:carnitine CoA-transferase CaiB-like acyl-CoA transferase
MGALDGIRVVELATVFAGPATAMHLADQGAEVIKVEAPIGDDVRRIGTMFEGESPSYLALNRNKRGIVLDLTVPEARPVLLDLLRRADVFITNLRSPAIARLALTYPELRNVNPRLIYARITGWGSRGAYATRPAYDLMVQALTGLLGSRTSPEGVPIGTGIVACDMTGCAYLAYGIALALLQRAQSGDGQEVEVSLASAGLAVQANAAVQVQGITQEAANLSSALMTSYAASDGEWLFISCINQREWERLCQALDVSHLTDDPLFRDHAARAANREALHAILSAVFAVRTQKVWAEAFQEYDIPGAPVLGREGMFEQPQFWENDYLVRIERPNGRTVECVGSPLSLSRQPATIRRPPPKLGEHTAEVLEELGYSRDRLAHLWEIGVTRPAS